MTELIDTNDRTRATTGPDRSGLVAAARWALAVLSSLFVIGALGQFFLVGLGMFDDGARWQDHKQLGSILGLVTYVIWIPALLGKTSRGLLLGTLMLFVLFMAQYAFINADSGIANAFHPLNGSVLLMLGAWIAQQSLRLARTLITRPVGRRLPQSLEEETA